MAALQASQLFRRCILRVIHESQIAGLTPILTLPLSKPFGNQEFLEAVRQVLEDSSGPSPDFQLLNSPTYALRQ
jgi:hypothetical protein